MNNHIRKYNKNGRDILYINTFQHAAGNAPNARSSSLNRKFETYYKCILVLFFSIRIRNPLAVLLLVTDKELPEFYKKRLQKIGVKQKILQPTKSELNNNFPGCLYLLDAIAHLEEMITTDIEHVCILDSDCIYRDDKPLEFKMKYDVLAYPIPYNNSRNINGKSIDELNIIKNDYTGYIPYRPFIYYGGEMYVINIQALNKINISMFKILNYIKENREKYGTNFTEEHVLSLLLNFNDDQLNVRDTQQLVKRVWTSVAYKNVIGNENEFVFLHLPAEKKRGFNTLFKLIEKKYQFNTSEKIDLQEFKKMISKSFPYVFGGKIYHVIYTIVSYLYLCKKTLMTSIK